MNRFLFRVAAAALTALLAATVTACGSSDSDTQTLAFQLTGAGCEPRDAEATAGAITFEAENDGGSAATGVEVLDGEAILGRTAELADGSSGSFSLVLDEGEYTLRCIGEEGQDGVLTVTGEPGAKPSLEAERAAAEYQRYVEENAAELVTLVRPFAAGVIAGDIGLSKNLYQGTRVPYERIEPVARSLGDLAVRIDAGEGDVPANEFGGYHRIEKDLWGEERTTAPAARQLLADVEELREEAGRAKLRAAQIANGASQLLSEALAAKMTGEEEPYAHVDLLGADANLEGAEAAFEAVKPLLEETDAELVEEIEADFDAVYADLEPYRTGNGFVSYVILTDMETRRLARGIEALAEKMSQVPAKIAAAEAGGAE